MAPEAPPAPVRGQAAPGGGSGNPLKRKIGPLPTWAWVLIALAGLLGVAYWRNRGTSSSSSGSASDSTGDTTDASQVPQFVNQTFTSVSPPTAPNPVPGPAPITTPMKPTPPPVGVKTLTVGRNMTLKQFAKEHNWTPTTLAAVEKLNHLKASSRLKKGQHIKRPWAPQQPGQPTLTGS
jgi:hypothetical protein